MMSFKKQLCLIILSMGIFCSQTSSAQVQRTVKRSVATVLFSTLGGAVLGLSTLPFYGEPQEHIDNITIGAVIGGFAGAAYLAYDASQNIRQTPAYDYSDLELLHESNKRLSYYKGSNLSAFNLYFSF